ncbi:MAG TPA: DinB family protein [Actinomycetota bacterium]|nr:DinB family protein [Actinomycetota bacterium]
MTELRHPSTTGSERELLIEYLDWYRDAIVRKMDGASDETLRAQKVGSATTLLGIVKHLAWVEIWWFQIVFAGRDIEDPWSEENPDADWRIEPHETTDEILAFYREACEESRAIVKATDDLDTKAVRPGKIYNLRRILIHMIEETARHAGHADILRELIDGRVGQ